MSPALPLTPPHTPAASLTPSSSINTVDGVDDDTDQDTAASRFVLLTHVPRDADSDTINRLFSSLVHSSPHICADPIKGMFLRLHRSEGKVFIAFFDSRKAAAAVKAIAQEDVASRLSVLLGGSPPSAIHCRFVSVSEIENVIGKSAFINDTNGNLVLSLEPATATELPDSESLASVKGVLDQYGDIRTFAAVDDDDPKTRVIHIEYYDLRDAQTAAKATNGLIVAGSRIRIFGMAEDVAAQKQSHGSTAKKNCVPFPASSPEYADREGYKEDQCNRNASRTGKQRPRSASAGTNTTDSARQALCAASPCSPTLTYSDSSPSGGQIHDVFGRRCSNQLLFDASRRSTVQLPAAVNVPAHEQEAKRRKPPNAGTWGLGEQVESAPVVTASGDGWFGLDDAFAGTGYAPTHETAPPPNTYTYHHQQNQYHFPSASSPDIPMGGSRGTYFQAPHTSFYGPSPSPLQYAPQPQPLAPTSPPMTFTGYEYDIHPGYPMMRPGAASGAGPWGLDHTMMRDYWYGGMPSQASGYYPAHRSHPTHNHHHQLHHFNPYTVPSGPPQMASGQFATFTFPAAPSPTSPMSFQPIASSMELTAPPESSVQVPATPPSLQISSASMTTPIETMPIPVASPTHEIDTGLGGMTGSVNISAGTSDRNQLNLARIADGQDTRTTVMIKNIPNKMSDKDLLEYIWRVCPRKIDFFYLRMDFRNECNVGYAFVNFIHVEDLLKFARARLDVKWNMYSSEKILHMSYANYQGKEALIEKFKNSCIMDEREGWRPKIFCSEPGLNQGLPEMFPPPTHFRRKERSSHNRGALFVPITGGSSRHDRERHHGSGHKRLQNVMGVGGGPHQHNSRSHRHARGHDGDRPESEVVGQGERMGHAGRSAPVSLGSRHANARTDHQRTSRSG